jgi:DNA polymerase-3 subunit delta'
MNLAPWIARQRTTLLNQQGHAWLLHGPSGLGQYPLAMELARAWLCENAGPSGACGNCSSCHAIDVRTHADLCMLLPETAMLDLGWPLSEKAQAEIDDKKRKPSKEIRVDAMRDALEFAQRTSARGRGKVVVVFPAEQMNNITANALLKTLEEPAGDVRFVLATESAHQLLPTIRSRCISHTLQWPSQEEAVAWLTEQQTDDRSIALALKATGGRPEMALMLAQANGALERWTALPKALRAGDGAVFKDWAAPMQIDALHKLCHDLMVMACGAEPRFFPKQSLEGMNVKVAVLSTWSKELGQAMRTMEHPFNAGLQTESLVSRAQTVLNSGYPRNS